MIGNRTQGLRLLSHAFVVLFMLLLFSVALLFVVYGVGHVDTQQVNLPLYFLSVLVAGLLSYRYKEDRVEDNDLNSFRWVGAIRKTNYQTIVLALMLFGVVFTTKDKAMSRLFVGSFLAMFWVTAVPLNRLIPEWIAGFAFRGSNSVRTVFLGSEKSARHLEAWAKRQPFYGIDIIGLITYEMATEIGVGILNLFNSDRGATCTFQQGKMRLNIWHKIVSLTLAKRAAGRVRGALKLKFKARGI